MKNNRLRNLRGSKTLEKVANEIGIPVGTYSCIEYGARRGRPETLHKIAMFYGIPMEQLFFSEVEQTHA